MTSKVTWRHRISGLFDPWVWMIFYVHALVGLKADIFSAKTMWALKHKRRDHFLEL